MKKLKTDKFITKAKTVHGDTYDYSLVDYINFYSKVKIICPEHGIFEQQPTNHLKGNKCPICRNSKNAENKKSNINEFIVKAKKVHCNKYDYSQAKYIDSKTKIKIICPFHGEFEQDPHSHLKGCGCSKCVKRYRYNTIEFINKAKLIHGNKYNYFLTEYISTKTKIKIICPIHGEFEQMPVSHLQGQGCSKCKQSKGENLIKELLIKHNIKYVEQKRFNDCRNKLPLAFDFYLPDHNICIEYDGIQHYKPIKYFGGEQIFKELKIRDEIKTDYCKKNGVNLIRIKYGDNIEDKLISFTN